MGVAMSFHTTPRKVRGNIPQVFPVRERLAAALRRTGASIKELARAADRTPKAVEHWIACDNEMSAATLLRLCRQYDEVWVEVREITGRANDEAEAVELLNQFAAAWKARQR
jgi:plasmid maintenance system antidote protein VapI